LYIVKWLCHWSITIGVGCRPPSSKTVYKHFSAQRWSAVSISRSAPLMRLALFQTGEESFYFTWCNHHLLIDGWSRATLFREVLASYEAASTGAKTPLGRGVPYRNYIAWFAAARSLKSRNILAGDASKFQ